MLEQVEQATRRSTGRLQTFSAARIFFARPVSVCQIPNPRQMRFGPRGWVLLRANHYTALSCCLRADTVVPAVRFWGLQCRLECLALPCFATSYTISNVYPTQSFPFPPCLPHLILLLTLPTVLPAKKPCLLTEPRCSSRTWWWPGLHSWSPCGGPSTALLPARSSW